MSAGEGKGFEDTFDLALDDTSGPGKPPAKAPQDLKEFHKARKAMATEPKKLFGYKLTVGLGERVRKAALQAQIEGRELTQSQIVEQALEAWFQTRGDKP